MGSEIYTREDLEKKKYNELQKIWRSLGAHNSKKRIKAEKLIESILEVQDQNKVLGDASAVADAFQEAVNAEEAEPQSTLEEEDRNSADELLTGIMAPDFSSLDDLNQNSSTEKQTPEEKDTDKKRKRTSTYDLFEDALESPPKRRARGSTYDIDDDQKEAEKAKNDVSSVNETAVQENNEQLASLNASITGRRLQRGRRIDPDHQSQISQEDGAVTSTRRTRRGVKSVGGSSLRPQSTRKAKSLYINDDKFESCVKEESADTTEESTVTVNSGDTDSINKKEPKVSEEVSASAEKEQVDKEADVDMADKEEPGVNEEETVVCESSAEVSGPSFTIGKSGSTPKPEGKEGEGKSVSKLPRFVAYARSLKMPNFNKIHAKAFNRMENLDDYMAKKKKKADILGSGKKKVPPVDPSKVFKPSVTSAKNISFNFAASKTTTQEGKTPKDIHKSGSQIASASGARSAKSQDCVTKPSLGKATKASPGRSVRSPPGRKMLTASRSSKNSRVTVSAVKPKSPKEGQKLSKTSPKGAQNVSKVSPRGTQKLSKVSPKGNQKVSKVSPKGGQKFSKGSAKSGAETKPSKGVAVSARKPLSPRQNTKPSKDVPNHKMNSTTVAEGKISPKNQTGPAVQRRASPRLHAVPQSQKENLLPAKTSTPAKSLIQSVKGNADTPGSAHKRLSYNPQASIAKPLKYKPYTGALKPLVEPSKVHHSRETLKSMAARNPNVKSRKEIRDGQKSILKGVRMNKRFELQMAKRGLEV